MSIGPSACPCNTLYYTALGTQCKHQHKPKGCAQCQSTALNQYFLHQNYIIGFFGIMQQKSTIPQTTTLRKERRIESILLNKHSNNTTNYHLEISAVIRLKASYGLIYGLYLCVSLHSSQVAISCKKCQKDLTL